VTLKKEAKEETESSKGHQKTVGQEKYAGVKTKKQATRAKKSY